MKNNKAWQEKNSLRNTWFRIVDCFGIAPTIEPATTAGDLIESSGICPDRQQTKSFDLMCNQTNHTNKAEASMAKVKRIKDLNDDESATS